MKYLVVVFALSLSSYAYAGDCQQMAIKAATDVFLNCENALQIHTTAVVANPGNTSNGVSLIVTVNESKYLILLSAASTDWRAAIGCDAVKYVIEYPYANLIRQ